MRWMMKPLAYPMAVVALAIAVFAFAPTAQAVARSTRESTTSLSPHTLVVEEDEDEAVEEEGEGEESEAEDEEDEAETGRSEPGLPQSVPEQCLDYTVAARAISSLPRQMVRLEVSYDSYESGRASLSFGLKGSKGSLKLGTAKWHISRWGHLERTIHLGDRELVKLAATRSFTVRVEMPGTPSYCEIYQTRRLTHRHQSGEQTVWSERSSDTEPLRRPGLQR